VGLIYDKLQLYKQAINEYRTAIQLEPSYANAHFILGQVYENKGIVEKAAAEYEKFVRIHETGAMVEEAKSRLAKLRNISIEELEQILNSKKQDSPDKKPAPVPEPTTKTESVPASTAAKSGLNLVDPKEHLRQVLAKAKAAKNPPPVQAETPKTISKPAPSKEAPPAPAKPGPALSRAEDSPAPVPATPPAPPTARFTEEAEASIPAYAPDQPLPASALDGYVLDEQEVLETIVQVDTHNAEQEEEVLEAIEAISSPGMAHPPEKNPEPAPPSGTEPTPTPTSSKPLIKRGFF